MFVSAAKHFKYFFFILPSAAMMIFCISCSTVKNYPVNKPFVYQTNITINGKFKSEEKKQLTDQLTQQLDDSIRVRRQQKLIFWHTLKNPPVYDSINAQKSVAFMNALLNSLGYYRDSITYKDTVIKVDEQLRTTINFTVNPGVLIRFDSIHYNLLHDSLQQITNLSLSKALIKKGDAFAKSAISSELDRLSDLYRDNGYLKFNNQDLVVLWDTVGLNLLRPTFDPIEQAQLLDVLRKRRQNPTADIEITMKGGIDTSHFIRYYVGNVTVYPDFNADTSLYIPTIDKTEEYNFLYFQYLFKPKKFTSFIYLHEGDLYRQSNSLKTYNKFNSISAWRLVSINQLPRAGKDTVDFEIKLTPAKKYAFTTNLEASKNQGDVLLQEGNLLGLGLDVALVNRNFSKAADQATTNLRYGIEFNAATGSQLIQTQQFTASHTIQFPRAVSLELIPAKYRENTRTFLALNAGYTDRNQYYNITSLNASWGYEFNWKNKLFSLRFPNIEYNLLNRESLLNTLISQNASYKYIFNDGLILSTIMNLKIAGGKNKTSNLANFGFETSGLLLGLLKTPTFDSSLYRFVKVDAEFTQTHKFRKSAFAWRAFAGVGYELPSSHNRNTLYLPFFREYYAGGPNSMRAWPLRMLGPGSSVKSFANDIAPDRFGDMRLETNAEYRFYLTQLFGFNLEGALFTDVGNVWFLRPNKDFPNGEFALNKLWKDIAIGAGTGLRVDFGFLKARFDYAYKVKNPSPSNIEEQNKWFYNWQLLNGQFQLGIDYPF